MTLDGLYTISKLNLARDSTQFFAAGTKLLSSEVVVDGNTEHLEVWIAIPVEHTGPQSIGQEPELPSVTSLSDYQVTEIGIEDDDEW